MTAAVSNQTTTLPQTATATAATPAAAGATASSSGSSGGILGMLTQRYKPITTRDITAVKALQIGVDPAIAGIAADAALGDANAAAVVSYIDQLTAQAGVGSATGTTGQQSATDAANAGAAVQPGTNGSTVAPGAGTAGSSGTAADATTSATTAAAQQQAAAQQAAQAAAQQQAAQDLAAQQAAAAQAQAATAAAPTTNTDSSATGATAAAATASGSGTSTTTAGPTSTGTGTYDYWSAHIAQFAGKYLPDGPSMRPNCGPASVTMALRLVGKDIPGFNGQKSEAVLDKAREIATGKNDVTVGTTDTELERVVTAAGAKWSESNDMDQMLGWVRQGIPVVMSGNPAKGWDSRYSNDQVYHFDGGHWVTVSGYDAKTGYYIVNDPLSQIGPIYVSKQELENYNNAHGKLGIAVFN